MTSNQTPKKIYQPIHEGLSDEEKRNENFRLLKEYLSNKNKKDISGDLFKAILSAVNGMTVFNRTKSYAIKNAAERYNVTQTSVKTIIDDMGIVSTRALEQKNHIGKEYGLSKTVNNRVLRDDLKE